MAENFYNDSGRIYGCCKVHEDIVQEAKIDCCREMVRRVLNEKALFSWTKLRFVVTTDSNHDRTVTENLLDRDFSAAGPNEKWTADITYILTGEGWMYLAIVLDVFLRRVVDWSMSQRNDAELACDALRVALGQQDVVAGRDAPQ